MAMTYIMEFIGWHYLVRINGDETEITETKREKWDIGVNESLLEIS